MNSHVIQIGLYGFNGHQLHVDLPENVRARVAGAATGPGESEREFPEGVKVFPHLDAMISDPEIDLVSLCSARRQDQAEEAIRCLKAGKHVLAEKPCAFDTATLERILKTAEENNRVFREMAASELHPSIQAIRRQVESGALGTIVHVQAHKSYPWHDRRPQDMGVDGGLVRQVGIHAVRFIHGVSGLRIKSIEGRSTGLGNPEAGSIQMAASFSLELENGAVGSVNLNYLNPTNFGSWGNDQVRIFGTKGMAESVDGLKKNALYVPGQCESTDLPVPDDLCSSLYIEHLVNFLLDQTPMPTPFEDEMAMTRAMLALHKAAETGKRVTVTCPDR